MELLIGCGYNRQKKIDVDRSGWSRLVTLDINSRCKPDIVYDLELGDLPFRDGIFDEVHAYEVLEHTGVQGDVEFFFKQFEEFWRVLKDGGLLCGTCPKWDNIWAWGDPGHKRVISAATLVFLDRHEVKKQVGKTNMTDYGDLWWGDFRLAYEFDMGDSWGFVLRAAK